MVILGRRTGAAAVAVACALLASGAPARKRQPPIGAELRLPLADPIVVARVGAVSLRLRVDFDQRDAIELTPDAAARLPLVFVPGGDAEVGRVVLPGRMAITTMTIAGQEAERQLATHDSRCCDGADGMIGAALLPFALVRLEGAAADTPQVERSYPMVYSKEAGLEIAEGEIRVQLSLRRSGTVGTKSAGAILSRSHGGSFDAGYSRIAGPFGIERPARGLTLGRPVTLAGFDVSRLSIRTADFGGRRRLPTDTAPAGEILVKRRVKTHHDWPSVVLGAEYFRRCAAIAFWTVTRTISLRCPAGAP